VSPYARAREGLCRLRSASGRRRHLLDRIAVEPAVARFSHYLVGHTAGLNTMLTIERLVAITIVCLVATPTHGQTAAGTRRTFVDASFGADWDDAYSSSTRVPGATVAAGFAWGFDEGRWGLELDAALPQWHEKHHPVQRYLYVGRTFGWQQQDHAYESSSTVRRRSIDVTAFLRANRVVNRRVTFAWLVGGGYVFRPEQFTGVTKEVLPDGQLVEVNTQKDSSSRNYIAAATRLDVEFKVAARVSIVPRVRVTIFPSLLDDSGLAPRIVVARPEVAVRWRLGTP
jgi:hypothetical protein